MSDFDQAFRDAVQPVTEELAMIEQRIQESEDELKALKASRTRGQKLLNILDPEAAATPKKKAKSNGSDWAHISEGKVEEILASMKSIRAREASNGHNDVTFTAQDVHDRNGIHVTTIHKALKILHERGQVRIDHLGGARNTTKFYALVGGEDV